MEIERLHALAIDVFKTINIIKPSFMKDIDIFVKHYKSSKYGEKSLIVLGLKIWNQIPSDANSLPYITKLKDYIRTWFGSSCKCNICRMMN